MISSTSQENDVIKWIFSEIINYHIKGKPKIDKYSRQWASKTRIHKLIYSIIEEFELNVTRSLYLWGGFVHSDILGEQFSHYRSYYHTHPYSVSRNREKIKELSIPVEEIQEYIITNELKAMTLDSINELQLYYSKNIPEQYNPLYTSKQHITYNLSNLSYYNNLANQDKIFNISNEVTTNFSTYHLSSMNLIEDERIIDINYKLTDIVETSLEKIKYYLYKENKIQKRTPHFFNKSNNIFNNFAWKPYACRVSQNTVRGLRSEIVKYRMRQTENSTINTGLNEIIKLKELSEKYNLHMSWEEYQYLNLKEEKADFKETINEIIKIYQKPDSE